MADAAQLSSLADETPEGRSIVVLAKEQYGLRGRDISEMPDAEFVRFTAQTRMSGLNFNGTMIRKGAADSVRQFVASSGAIFPAEIDQTVERISRSGGARRSLSPHRPRQLGVIHPLRIFVKSGSA